MTIIELRNLLDQLGIDVAEGEVKSVSGGDINFAVQIPSNKGKLFMKYNSNSEFPDMLRTEAKGLEILSSSKCIGLPEVINQGAFGDWQYLVLEWIPETQKDHKFWSIFGKKLAQLHLTTSDFFGLDHDNYIGSLPQKNEKKDAWDTFYFENRLEPLMRENYDAGLFTRKERNQLERLSTQLYDIVPAEAPALLHGDLWNGNYMSSSEGPVLIDPSVYYGHREMDIAMMHLFGGFHPELFEAYHQFYPLEKGWEDRLEVHQLYPLLVHTSLFGSSYAQSVKAILAKY
jgi:fructosamine-3-kinase